MIEETHSPHPTGEEDHGDLIAVIELVKPREVTCPPMRAISACAELIGDQIVVLLIDLAGACAVDVDLAARPDARDLIPDGRVHVGVQHELALSLGYLELGEHETVPLRPAEIRKGSSAAVFNRIRDRHDARD